jgi:serine/threonine protein kinase
MDFNVSSRNKNKSEVFRMMTKTGTVAFSAPEIFTQRVYDEKVDIWSAGIVLYMMLSGKQPFYDENVSKLV